MSTARAAKSLVPLALFITAVAAWSCFAFRRGLLADAYRDAAKADPIAAFDLPNPARTSDDALAESDALSRQVFPPRNDEAARLLATALRRDPMNPELWFEFARVKILLGEREAARAALERSDALDPRYPRQRMDAIDLWDYLGEPDRSRAVAAQLVSLGGGHRTGALRKLVLQGQLPAEVFDAFGLASLAGADLADALTSLHGPSTTPEAMRDLFAKADLAKLDSPTLRNSVAGLTVAPPIAAPAIALWRAQAPGLQLTAAGAPHANAALTAPPLTDPFPYGWQPLATNARAALRWQRPEEGDSHGAMEIRVAEGHESELLHWYFYRMPLPAGSPLAARVRLRAASARAAEVWRVACSVGESILQSEPAPGADREFVFNIEPDPADRIVLFGLGALPAAARLPDASPVFIEGIAFE